MSETVIYEDAERRELETVSVGWPDAPGATRTVRTEWKVENEITRRAAIEQQARQALANNRTFVALASPTNAQNAAQIKALSRQMNGVIRLLLGALDGTD